MGIGIGSLGFLACLAVGVMLFHLTPARWLRRLLLVGVNLAYLMQFFPGYRNWLGLALILGGSYLGLRWLKAKPFRAALGLFIVVCVVAFVWIKQYSFLQYYSNLLGWSDYGWANQIDTTALNYMLYLRLTGMIGLSYMLFRLIHMAVDQWQEQLEPYTLLSYVNYQINLFALVAGPIQRYNDYHKFWTEMDSQPRTTQENLLSWNRIITGTIKMAAIAPAIQMAYQWLPTHHTASHDIEALLRLTTQFYGYPLYLYFNFSGYTDVAVASAQLLGQKLPENFNYPFLARNVIDFWNRWHISLTHWIRDYVFMTSYKAAAERFPNAARKIGYFLIFVALFVAGLWHGSTNGFAIFGALHGLGAAAGQAYGDTLQRWLGPAAHKRYLKNPLAHVIAVVVTFHFVCFTFLFSRSGMSGAKDLLVNACQSPCLAYPYAWAAITVVAAVSALIIWLLWALWHKGGLLAQIDRVTQAVMARPYRLYCLMVTQTALAVFLLLMFWAVQEGEVVVAYQKF